MRILRGLAAAAAALLIAGPAAAQLAPRKIPVNALRGTYAPAPFPGAYINGKLVQMAPGVRVVLPDNRSVPPGQVAPDTPVRYELDARGQVRMIWVLTPEEARKR
jgi:hypothetical protein